MINHSIRNRSAIHFSMNGLKADRSVRTRVAAGQALVLTGFFLFIVLVNPLAAQSGAPKVIRTNPANGRVLNKNASRCEIPQSIDITFDKAIDPASLTLDNLYAVPQSDGCQYGQIRVAGVCAHYDPCLAAKAAYSPMTRTASIGFVMTDGTVFVYVNAASIRCGTTTQFIRGSDGQVLDGDNDGKPGGTYTFSYRVVSGARGLEIPSRKK